MHIILGATGHVGGALARALLDRREPVTVVVRDRGKVSAWEAKGARAAVVDVHDVAALREVFRSGTRAFLLNPPAPPSTDAPIEEQRTARAIVRALDGSGLAQVVALSTYGAQPGERIADSGVLYEMEQLLAAQPIPATVIRGAYYLSNWDASLETARKEGKVYTMYPADFVLPMVAPDDIGQLAAQLILTPVGKPGRVSIEGPATYTPADVAAAFADALGRPVEVVTTPREQWVPWLEAAGFSRPAAESMAAMTALALAGPERPPEPVRGKTTLPEYVRALVARKP